MGRPPAAKARGKPSRNHRGRKVSQNHSPLHPTASPIDTRCRWVRAVRNIDSTKVTPSASKNLPGCASESPANREFECGLGLEIVQATRVMENGVQLRLDLQWKNRRVDPIESVFQEIHIIGIYKGRGSNDRFVQAVHIICVIEAEGGLHDRQLHDKLDARRAAKSNIGVRRDGELLLHVAPGKRLGEILEAWKVQVE